MKVVRHSHHEQFLRLANEDAALLVSSGRWVYTSKFEARAATQRPHRRWPRIATLIAGGLAMLALLMLASSAKAAGLPCLSKAEAMATGKHARYRQVTPDRRCWFVSKRTPAKSEFTVKPRATGVAITPARPSTQEQQRVQAASTGSIPVARNLPIATEYTATLIEDAFMALTGRSEQDLERATFDAMWSRAMRDAAGTR